MGCPGCPFCAADQTRIDSLLHISNLITVVVSPGRVYDAMELHLPAAKRTALENLLRTSIMPIGWTPHHTQSDRPFGYTKKTNIVKPLQLFGSQKKSTQLAVDRQAKWCTIGCIPVSIRDRQTKKSVNPTRAIVSFSVAVTFTHDGNMKYMEYFECDLVA